MIMQLPREATRLASLVYRHLNTGTGIAAACQSLLDQRRFAELADMTVDPSDYVDPEVFRRDYQCVSFLKKLEELPTGIDKKKAAWDSFQEAEVKCTVTNQRLALLKTPSGALEYAYLDILSLARKWLSRVLGPLPDNLEGAYGPGTVRELEGVRFSTVAHKNNVAPGVTRNCEPVYRLMSGDAFTRYRDSVGRSYVQYIRGDRFTTVPKNAKTHRGINIGPGGNIYCQLGVGRYLKERCARVGLYIHRSEDLEISGPLPSTPTRRLRPEGQDLHRTWAREGSITGGLATIDLRSASDTVSKELVRLLLPEEWLQLLDSLRSPVTSYRGKNIYLEKWSSMGNGYTFELETLVFASLLAGCGLRPGFDSLVYGDDIIIPTSHVKEVLAVLKFSGLEINTSKSYTAGPFRESCGGDYFWGEDVRPFFLKALPQSPTDWMEIWNELRKRSFLNRVIKNFILEQVPVSRRLFGPESIQGVFHRRFYSAVDRKVDGYHQGYPSVAFLFSKAETIPLHRFGPELQWALALYGASSAGIAPRGMGSSLRVGWASVS